MFLVGNIYTSIGLTHMRLHSQALEGRTLKTFRLHLLEQTMVFIDWEQPDLKIFAIAARSTVCKSTVSSGHLPKIFFLW